MKKASRIALPILLVVLSAWSGAGMAGRGTSGGIRAPAPIVLSTSVDHQKNVMTIVGTNFGNEAPSVKLGGKNLEVVRHSATEIVVNIPPITQTSTFLLTVTNSGINQTPSADFNAVIFATAD
ncbi:IPT/TIG domain-containing protein [Methylococcus sp. EFPC2]|uniref:IPT/TIG domain-containing protein n=1 Tax=Methylococcus sp. EFPC2 TaxID=2812648 RepID=UPI0019676BBE|nr:IPT/TIG domain-containing protein [Methylococcus sp. EFPC2]QSA96112.1 IPT/TIG domain-containing protein [Methylococcus sp. EFPC2]